MPSLLLVVVVGYLIGSIPTAFLFVRWKSQVDIRKVGSGNVGTLNSYEVTKSKLVGVAVLGADFLKGVVAVHLASFVAPEAGFTALAVGGVAAVVGHNYPVWLRFRGGRGLATAAGVLISLQWLVVAFWGVWWAIGFWLTRKVNVGNAVGCLAILLVVLLLPEHLLAPLLPAGADDTEFRLFGVVLIGVVLIKHVAPVKQYLVERRANAKQVNL
ncbi:MAG: glycerol-3-phosphate acyltransferase [Bacteroidota bacterium]